MNKVASPYDNPYVERSPAKVRTPLPKLRKAYSQTGNEDNKPSMANTFFTARLEY